MEIYNQPIISKEFLEKYKNKQPNWGFNGLGYVVYKRTYSRLKSNGSYEEWFETVARCINGAQEIGADYSKEEAERLYDYIFNLKCSFAGRMLWMLGTNHIKRWGANALINCFFITITEYEDFCFIFENLMLGGGVGFSVRREDIHELPEVKEDVKINHLNTKDTDFIVPDSREGWVYLLRKVLKSFFVSGKSFTYSTILVRGYGEPIKGLGGTASGAKILVDGIENICKIFYNREGKKLRSIDVLDICNIIASIVVSGNIRRSATIALGDPDDYLYIRAKRWDLGNVPNWRALSNNTIYADDFTHIQNDIWEGYSGNGEPYGFFNIKLAQKVGRIGELKKDNCEGVNPCFTGDTKIETLYGQIPIKDLIEKETLVYCYDGHKINISKMKNIHKTGIKQEVWEIILDNDKEIKVTPNHKFMLKDGTYKAVKDLKLGDSLMPFYRYKRNSKGYKQLSLNSGEHIGEAQFVCEWKYNRKNKVIPFDNHKIKSIKFWGYEDVYDGEVEKYHNFALAAGIIVHNCGELVLSSGEVCCLSDLFLNNINSKEELIDCAKLLYKTQKAICSMKFLHEKTEKIVHKNFRIGIGITGVCQSLDKIEWLDDCYKEIKKFDKEWSKKKGYPESIRLTTIKPSGCGVLDTKIKTEIGILTYEEIFKYFGYNIKSYKTFSNVWFPIDKKLKIYNKDNKLEFISNLYLNGEADVYEFQTEDKVIHKFTEEHKFLIKNRGWIKVKELKMGDEIISYNELSKL